MKKSKVKKILEAVARHDNPQLRTIVLTAIFTGMSESDILALRSEHIDFAGDWLISPSTGAKFKLPSQLMLAYKRNLKNHEAGYLFEFGFGDERFIYNNVSSDWSKVLEETDVEGFDFNHLQAIRDIAIDIMTVDKDLMMDLTGFSSKSAVQKWAYIHDALGPDHTI